MSDNNSQIVFDSLEQMECPSCHAQVDVHAVPAFSEAVCPGCQATFSVPGRLGTFLLLSCLGSGGMGSVYRAFDQTLARIVAIKVMLKSLGDQPEFVASFQREAQAAAKLNHPNIAQIYSFGQEKGQPYIVMELVPGKHFDEMIAGPEFLDQALVMKIGMDIADGLQLAAASNLIHGDIKPENILLDDRGVAKLVDFGIASAPSKGAGEIWGTPYYIAPEKLRRQRVDYRSDIYCLGGTLYHALTKHPPFDGEDAMAVVKARLEGPPAPMKDFRPDIDPEISEIIDRMLQLEPAMRYPTYGSLLSDMRRYLERARPQSAAPAIGGGKRIVIKKGRGRGKTSQALPAGAASSKTATGRHPLVVSRGMVDPRQSQQLTANLAGAGPAHRENDGEEPRKPRSRAAKVAIGCGVAIGLFVLLLVLGGLGVYFHFKNEGAKRADRWALLQKTGQSRLDAIDGSARALEQFRDSVLRGYAVQADGIVSQALGAVEAELGADAATRERILEEEIPPEPSAGADESAPAEAGLPADGTSTNAPAADQPGQDGAPSPTNVVAEVEEEPLEGLPLMARQVFLALRPVRDADRRIGPSLEKLQVLSEDARELLARGEKGKPASFMEKKAFEEGAAGFDKTLGELKGKQEEADGVVALVKDAAEGLPKAVKEAQSKLDGLLAVKAGLEKERAKAAAEEAARQLEQNELAKLEMVASEALAAMKEHRYGDVIRSLEEVRDLRSDGARKRLEVLKRRAKALLDLHAFLVMRISEKPVAIDFKMKGASLHWLISEANKRNLTVSNSGGDPVRVPWTKIGPEQMVPLIRHYLETPANARKMKLLQRTRQQLNAAVYYVIFGAGNPSAMKSAKALVEKIVADRPSMKDDVEGLLPELFEAPGPSGEDEPAGEPAEFQEP